MTQNQQNRVTMFGTVAAYLEANRPIWGTMKAAADTLTELQALNAQIAQKAGRQQAPTTGAAEQKAQLREDYEAAILEIGDQLSSLAATRGDAALGAQVELTKTRLGKIAEDELEAVGGRVAGLARTHLAALADYNLTAAEVTELERLTAEFHRIKTAPRQSIAGRAGETATLPELITAATDLLRDRLDKQMTRFRLSHPEFYAGYGSARVVVDRRGSSGGSPAPGVPAPSAPM